MALRNNDTRRRRIVIDPAQQEPGAATSRPAATSVGRHKKTRKLYKSGAERRYQWKTTDLLPKRPGALTLVVSLLVLAIAGLNVLFFYSARWADYVGSTGLSSLQLSGRATLAAWFSSFLLIISGFASLQIYALRQHRRDDYRGSYRLWLWMAVILVVASVNCIVDLTAIFTNLIQSLTRLSSQHSVMTLLIIKLALLSGLVARGSYEVRESRAALVLVALVWIAYGAALILRLPQMQPILTNVDARQFQVIHGNLLLFGTATLLLAQIVFSRFVYLQALGLIKPRRKSKTSTSKAKTKSKPKSANAKAKTGKAKLMDADGETDSESETLKTTATSQSNAGSRSVKSQDTADRKPTSTSKSNSNDDHRDELEEESDDVGILRLSKSEQRRQRKQQQQQQRSNRRAA